MSRHDEITIAALLERIGRLVGRESRAEGLQPVQWEALRYLARANRFSRTAASLTLYLGQTKGTVSQSLMALQSKGLIRKETDAKDKRTKRLVVSARGKRVLSRDPMTEMTEAIGELPAKQRENLAAGLESLLLGLLEKQDRQPFGQCKECTYFGRHHADGSPHYCQLLEERLSQEDASKICVEQIPRTA